MRRTGDCISIAECGNPEKIYEVSVVETLKQEYGKFSEDIRPFPNDVGSL